MSQARTVEEEKQEMQLLPLCEANRQLVVNTTYYASNIVFNLGSLKLIDKAP